MISKKIESSIIGFIVGDALGVPFEFLSRAKLKLKPVTTMTEGGSWDQPLGTWSDDTSMVIATLDSLPFGYSLEDLGQHFDDWLYQKHYTPHGKVFDIGSQTKEGLNRIHKLIKEHRSITPLPPGIDEKNNGNGSLMRILPFGFYLQKFPIEKRWEMINEVSSLTHPHIRSVIGCFIYSELVIELMVGDDKLDSYKRMQDRVSKFLVGIVPLSELDLFERILNSEIRYLTESEIRSSSYVIHTLEAVFWCFLSQNNFKDAVLTGVNLGEDTDTIGALIGGLAGITYNDIPTRWVESLVKKQEILRLIDVFIKTLPR